ncbi:MAG: sulfatase-like hydrolase/transferase, partial [Verrucomicrobiota bacterium]
RSLLENPGAEWGRPALMSYGRGNHAVRSEQWRYIRYEDGSEELYDHETDPHEWTNLASDPRFEEVMVAHRKWLPEEEASPVPDRKRDRNAENPSKPALMLSETKPNLLLIVSEDNGPDLGCYGAPYVKTPVLDELAAGGILFEHAYVPQAGCSQSRSALLTGLYPHQNGQIGLATWNFRMYREETPNLVRSLREVGYRTGIIGKLHINPESAFPFDVREIGGSNFGRRDLGDYAEKAMSFMMAGNEPFFLSVNYPDAHRPFRSQVQGIPSDPLKEEDVQPLAYFGLDSPELRQQTAGYLNCISRLDSLIGDLLEALERSGKKENTLIVYLGDHGADLLRGKRTSYEGGVRVPLILHGKGVHVPGRRVSELVSTLDIMPTLLATAGAKKVDGLPGRYSGPFLDGESPSWRKYLFTEFHLHSAHNFYPQRTVRDQRYKLIMNLLPGRINPGYAFTNARFFNGLSRVIDQAPEEIRTAYQRMHRPPLYELYDLRSDPFEFVNLAEEEAHLEVLNRLAGVLEQWREDSDDPFLIEENVQRLQEKIEASMLDGVPDKALLNVNDSDFYLR